MKKRSQRKVVLELRVGRNRGWRADWKVELMGLGRGEGKVGFDRKLQCIDNSILLSILNLDETDLKSGFCLKSIMQHIL
jgi:hypothetical protein